MVKSGTKGRMSFVQRTEILKVKLSMDSIGASLNWRFKCIKTQWSCGSYAVSHFTETLPLGMIGIFLPKRYQGRLPF